VGIDVPKPACPRKEALPITAHSPAVIYQWHSLHEPYSGFPDSAESMLKTQPPGGQAGTTEALTGLGSKTAIQAIAGVGRHVGRRRSGARFLGPRIAAEGVYDPHASPHGSVGTQPAHSTEEVWNGDEFSRFP
jgi:hypothetical protein